MKGAGVHTMLTDVRHAWRALAKRPGFSVVIVLTLGLALGANAAIFAMIDAVVLRPFTLPDVDRVVLLSHTRQGDLDRQGTVSPANFLELKAHSAAIERLSAFEWWDANLVGRDEPELVQGFRVSSDFFPAIGITPAMGRTFVPEEEVVGRHRRVVLGHGLWQRRFGGDPTIIGRAVQIDGVAHDIVGIAPEGFEFPLGAQVWAPLAFTPEAADERVSRSLTAIGRLAAGRTLDDARAEMTVFGERLAKQHPAANKGLHVRVYTLAGGMIDIGLGPILTLWQAAAGFVLLIACANVAGLLLARDAERQREMAVRVAMGASRLRITRVIGTESVLLAVAAVPIGLATAWAGLSIVRGYMPAKIARFVSGWDSMDIDGRLVVFTIGLALVTAAIFGLVPAVQASRPRLADSLKDGSRGATAGAGRVRFRRGLVVAEIALTLPLLVASALSALSVHRFLHGPQGYDPAGVLSMQLVLPESEYPDDASRHRFAASAVERLRALPGVETAAAVNIMPARASNSARPIEIEGAPTRDPADRPTVDYRAAMPTFFDTIRIPIVEGRPFDARDSEDGQPVVIVSRSLARKYWGTANPIGRRMKMGTSDWLVVVGVAGDHIHDWFARRNYPTAYRPFSQAPTGEMSLLVRTAGDGTTLAQSARLALHAIDPDQAIFDVMTMREALAERTLGLHYVAGIMAAFGLLALVLALAGIYGVMSYIVTLQTHEIGVRMALGASARDVLRLAVGQAVRVTALGAGLGVLLSLALGRLMEAAMVGAASSDTRIVAGLAALLATATLGAGYLPARRAAAVDPIVALRAE